MLKWRQVSDLGEWVDSTKQEKLKEQTWNKEKISLVLDKLA